VARLFDQLLIHVCCGGNTSGFWDLQSRRTARFGIYSREEQLAVVARSKDEALREAIEVWMIEEQSGEFWEYSADDISFNQLARPAANPHEGLMEQIARDLENREEWIDVYPIGTRDFY
jgi:hypothetical protein